eukprot:TRINITY_DN2571_c0_g1_i1.p1 TRINITY_DN2571_c0_g1~~TRINITY_DN2571_c0_g1_i1.p1  ORF type:complete len:398 (-),score=96.77 TRINITY_DN2571_c0_g1_i1:42-1235(-)
MMESTWKRVIFTVLMGLVVGSTGFYESQSSIHTLNKDNFLQVLQTNDLWVVEFFAPWCGHCKAFAPEFTKAAENLQGLIHFGAVNCDVEKELCGMFKIEGLPTITLFPSELTPLPDNPENFIKNPIVYPGARKASPLVRWAVQQIPKTVSIINDDTYKEKLEENDYVLLVSNKETVSNLYSSVALTFKDVIPFFQAHSSNELIVSEFGTTDFPSVYVISDGTPHLYKGDLHGDHIRQFIVQHIDLSGHQRSPGANRNDNQQAAKEFKSNPLYFADTDEVFLEACGELNLCFIGVLDPADPLHETRIATLNELNDKYQRINFVWVDGPNQFDVKEKFYLADGFPQGLILHRGKMRVKVLMKAFSVEAISDTIDMVVAGSSRVTPISELPKFKQVKEDL